MGGLRTALYNYLFAKHNGGKCILRIEDTDRSRYVEEATQNLLDSLNWAGVYFDESPVKGGDYGPYVQSERSEIYRKFAQQLIESGHAYYAFDTPEELKEMRERMEKAKKDPKYDRINMRNSITLGEEKANELIESGEDYVIRLKVPEKEAVFHDKIRGEVRVHGKEIDDQVLQKSDGFPTYHLANVVDDHLMEITHVIRGEEWLPSTPKHVILYEAFGWDCPEFAHLPLLLNEQKQKLSKRHGDVAAEDFRAKGYLREAFVNFIALLGWNPTGDRDIYTLDELIELFNIEKVNKGGAVFDLKKLDWMQQQYLKEVPSDELVPELKNALKKKDWDNFDEKYYIKVINLFKERMTFVHELPDKAPYMFVEPQEYEEKYLNKHWKEDTAAIIKPLIENLRSLEEFTHDNTHSLTKQYVEDRGLKLKVVIHPLRLMITGMSVGAGMFETMEVLGKQKCMERIDRFMNKMESGELQQK